MEANQESKKNRATEIADLVAIDAISEAQAGLMRRFKAGTVAVHRVIGAEARSVDTESIASLRPAQSTRY